MSSILDEQHELAGRLKDSLRSAGVREEARLKRYDSCDDCHETFETRFLERTFEDDAHLCLECQRKREKDADDGS